VDLTDTVIRRAVRTDLPALGRLGASLMRQHYDFDRLRFIAPGERPEDGYAWFLGTQLEEDDVVVFVADQKGSVVGYVYAGIEPMSWKDLRDRCGAIHDLVVDESGRRHGVGAALMEAALEWMRERGLPRAVLATSPLNERAQRLFDRLGFRRTMIEMTRELPLDDGKQ
jgi:ribosomal protein S18 acetylase RimI-like enzyme